MKKKNVLLSSLIVLGFLTAGCNKQNVVSKNEKMEGANARFINIGEPIFGSGNAYEVPYFFANMYGIFYPTTTKGITGLKLTVPEAVGNTYTIYYATNPNNFSPTSFLANNVTFVAGANIIQQELKGILPTTGPNAINVYLYLKSVNPSIAADIADGIITIPMYSEFQTGITTSTSTGINAAALGISQTGADLAYGNTPGTFVFNLTIADLTAGALTSAMLANSYQLNTMFVAYTKETVGSNVRYISGNSYTPANKPIYLKANIIGATAANNALPFSTSISRNNTAYVISGYASAVGTAAAGQNQTLSFADQVLGQTTADITALSAQLGYGL